MRKGVLASVVMVLLGALLLNPASAAVKAGTSCTKLNQKTTSAGYTYTCIKSGKKLVWSKGVKVVSPNPIPSSTPSPTPSQSPTAIGDPVGTIGVTPTPSPTPTPTPIPTSQGEFAPSPVSNAHAAYLGQDIVLTFDFDTTATNNKWINQFYIDIYDPSTSKWLSIAQVFDATSLNKTSSSQTITLTFEILASTGIANTTNITNVRIATSDAVLHKSVYVETGAPNPAYASMFDTPNITLSHGTDWYSVKVNNLDAQISKGLFGIIVEENVTTEANVNNIDSSKWVQASQSTLVSPIVIYAPDDAHRWVRVKFISKSGRPSSYSVPQDVTPDTFIKSNTTPRP